MLVPHRRPACSGTDVRWPCQLSELASEALRGGAAGFVLKQSAFEELMTAIDEALQGRVYLSPEVAGGRERT